MNEHPLDDMLAARCAAASPSASFEASIARALEPIEHAPGSRTATAHTPRPNRRNANARSVARPRWQQACRAAAAVAAIALCVGGTAYAAEKLGLSLWQTDKYQVQVEPPVDENAGPATGDGQDQLIDEYRLTFSYIPDSLPDRNMDVDTGYFGNEEGFEGYSQFAPSIEYYTYYIDTDESAPFSGIESSEVVEVGKREAALLQFDYGIRDSRRQTQTRLYVAFPDERRIVRLQTSTEELRDELMAIAEGMTFEATGETESLELMFAWGDAIAEANHDAEQVAERAVGNYADPFGALSDTSLTDEQMGPFRSVGDVFPLPGSENLSGTVTSVAFHDDAPPLDRDEMPLGWRSLIGADGSIGEDTLSFVKYGDGQSATDSFVKQVSSPLKLLEVQIALVNEGTEVADDVHYSPCLESAVHSEGVWSQYRRASECPGADEAQNGLHVNDKWCSYHESVEDGRVGGIDDSLGSIAPGETKTVRFFWLVNADECDKLLLDIDPDGMNGDDEGNYADGTWGSRFIDIRQPQ